MSNYQVLRRWNALYKVTTFSQGLIIPGLFYENYSNKKGRPESGGLFYFWEYLLLMATQQTGDGGCLRMGIDKNQRNNQCVNTQRFDHGQTDQQGNGDLT